MSVILDALQLLYVPLLYPIITICWETYLEYPGLKALGIKGHSRIGLWEDNSNRLKVVTRLSSLRAPGREVIHVLVGNVGDLAAVAVDQVGLTLYMAAQARSPPLAYP